MTKKLTFRYNSVDQDINYTGVIPAKKTIPEWYKRIPSYLKPRDGLKHFGRDLSTIKKCMPFFEGLSFGYMLTLPFDILVESTAEDVTMSWQVNVPDGSVEVEMEERIPGLIVPDGYSKKPMRLNLFPSIITPKGHSILITHPINRYDLPFYTFGAVVDADYDGMQISATMLVKKDFKGILEKGTPIAQIIPFKRDDWLIEKGDVKTKEDLSKEIFGLTSTIKNAYVKNFWHKKNFN